MNSFNSLLTLFDFTYLGITKTEIIINTKNDEIIVGRITAALSGVMTLFLI